jgi:D-threo-aldose 1-dehydrogenase
MKPDDSETRGSPGSGDKPAQPFLPRLLGRTGIAVPPVVFGTSCLGNLYEALAADVKLAILGQYFRHLPPPVVLDTAGKYGAGLALETIGAGLRRLSVPPREVLISNKLGWLRTPLLGPEPTFEPGVWKDLAHDAAQRISYEGMFQCWEQGCGLLGAPYVPGLVSVHDPDEYLAGARSPEDRGRRWEDILGAYRALGELKAQGKVAAVGVGSKDWRVIRDLADVVNLDWVMLACSLTIYSHPRDLLDFVERLHHNGVGIINSAVFHAGFLTGGPFFDYRKLDPARATDQPLFRWRDAFTALCRKHQVAPAAACVQFGLSAPGVASIALNTSRPERVRENVALATTAVPGDFWNDMKAEGLIDPDYPHL